MKLSKEQILGILRHTLTFVGGILIAKGIIDGTSYEEISGAILTLAGSIWSIVSKKS